MLISKFMDPKNDFAFKRIFGSERNKDILIHFLNDVLVFKDGAKIKDLTFLKTTLDPEMATQKQSLVDVLCSDENGNQYIVEMQVADYDSFEKRAQYYAAKVYASQARKGGPYTDLKEVVFLGILDFIVFPEKKSYASDHVLLDKKTLEHDLRDLSFTFLELPKFNKEIHQLETMVEKWMYFFKHADETTEAELENILAKDMVIKKAYQELNKYALSEEEYLAYEHQEKVEWDNREIERTKIKRATEQATKQGLQQGREQGLQQGREQGLQQGREQGLQQGREQGLQQGREQGVEQNKLDIAKNMLAKGYDVESISLITQLPLQKIEELSRESKIN